MKDEKTLDGIINRFHNEIIKSGYSYTEISNKTGIPRATIQRWATGKKKDLPLEGIKKICQAIGADTTKVMGWTEKEPAEADPRIDMIYNLLKNMSDDNLMKLLDYARYLIAQQSQ